MTLRNLNSASILLAAAGVAALAAPLPAAAKRTLKLAAGTVIAVKMDDSLSSRDASRGQSFTSTVTGAQDSQYGSDLLPAGTHIHGVVRSAHAKHGKTPGSLDLAFNRMTLPDGRSYAISGSLIALDNKSVTRSNGRLVAKPGHRASRLTYVGIGAGAGFVLSTVLDSRHAVRNTALGAAAGYLFGALEKSHSNDVNLKSGQAMGVRLDRGVTVTTGA